MANYKLGMLIGSGCDTLPPDGIGTNVEEKLVRIIPNPADKYAYVEVGKPSQYDISLIDITVKL